MTLRQNFKLSKHAVQLYLLLLCNFFCSQHNTSSARLSMGTCEVMHHYTVCLVVSTWRHCCVEKQKTTIHRLGSTAAVQSICVTHPLHRLICFLLSPTTRSLEQQATTAAGDQAFLGRYHRRAGLPSREGERHTGGGRGDETRDATTTPPWVGSSVPLATNHAVVAVCASRGWVAVCTGSVVSCFS